MSLRLRGLQLEIGTSLLVVMLAGFALVGVVLASLVLRTVQESTERELRLVARQVEWAVERAALRPSEVAILARTMAAPGGGAQWSFLDRSGRAIGPLASAAGLLGAAGEADPGARADLLSRAWRTGGASDGRGLPVRDIVVARVVRPPDARAGLLVGVVPRERLLARLAPVGRVGVALLAIAALCFVGFASYTLHRRIVRPVRSLAAATERVAAGDFDFRTEPEGCTELVELGLRFNEMAASLAAQRDTVRAAHDSLGRSQRLATVGQLAAGVAHEVGNPIAAVLGYAEVVLRDPGATTRSKDAAERIRAEVLRVRERVRELLDLARADRLEVVACAPALLLERLRSWLAPQKLLRDIALEIVAEDGLPAIAIDTRRIEQALVNLVENAAHAVVGSAEPRIVVRAEAAPRPGSVTVSVEDNGPGIAEEDLPAIFDPFFSTKDPGAGTGLGLWNAQRIAFQLGGQLEVATRPGCTRFSLILPAADTEGSDGSTTGADHR